MAGERGHDMGRVCGAVVVAVLFGAGMVGAGEPGPALTVRAVRPDRQLERILALFEGAPASSPAAALAAWRRATGDRVPLGKPAQALVALLNPEMGRELRGLDGAEMVVRLDGESPRWFARLPADDGAIAALGAALALTDGGAEPPLPDATVDRLGPPGTPLLARTATGAVALGGSRSDLIAALDGACAGRTKPAAPESGWTARFRPGAVGDGGPIAARRLAGVLRAIGCRELDATASLDGQALTLVVDGRYGAAPPSRAALDPSWLDWVPADRAAAAVAVAIGPGAWDAAFAAADRLEAAGPARSRAAPLRARLGLIAAAAGARLEADLRPALRGATVWIDADASGRVAGALVALHAADPDAAAGLADRVVKPLAGTIKKWVGRDLEWTVRGSSVAVAWGEGVLAAGVAAREHPERSAARALRAAWPAAMPRRAGAVWPGRWMRDRPALAGAFEAAGPVVWWGTSDGTSSHDLVRWDGLRNLVRDGLDRLPLRAETRP